MDHKEKLIALLNTLQTSVDSNLNASITPDDCKLLLTLISQAHKATKIALRPSPRPSPPPPVSNRSHPLDRFVESLADLGKTVIDELADDIRPKRRR